MSPSILITGAAGYIGGSIVADFLAKKDSLIEGAQIIAAVRSEEQVTALSKLGITVLQLDLSNEEAVTEGILRHNVNIVIHTASSLNPDLALNLVNGLSKYKEATGVRTYFIHTSGLSAFCESTGWPHGVFKDTGPIFDVEKSLQDSFPLRKTDVAVIEHAKSQGVTSFIVVPSTVYGKGSGEWNKLSVLIPIYIHGILSGKKVYRFSDNTIVSGVHITDMTALYGTLVEKILKEETIPSGTEGYYFALPHKINWWELLDHLAKNLQARGLVTDAETEIWPNDEVAAELLGVPVQYVQLLWKSGETIIAENATKIGWKPEWNKDRFLQNLDAEIDAVIELKKAKSSLVDSLFASVKG